MTAGGSLAFVLYFATREHGVVNFMIGDSQRLSLDRRPTAGDQHRGGELSARCLIPSNAVAISLVSCGSKAIHRKRSWCTSRQTIHGVQRSVPHQHEPTTYYGHQSGVGKVLEIQRETGPIKVCGVGLGCGNLRLMAPHDRFDFIEINPEVIRLANKRFSFLSDSRASVRTILGDGRPGTRTNGCTGVRLAVLDAFSSDSIPTHLADSRGHAVILHQAVRAWDNRAFISPTNIWTLRRSFTNLLMQIT